MTRSSPGIVRRLLARLWNRIIDMHEHACDACGRVWRHAGLLTPGGFKSRRSQRAHTCACGKEQWWRIGEKRESGNEVSP